MPVMDAAAWPLTLAATRIATAKLAVVIDDIIIAKVPSCSDCRMVFVESAAP